MNWSWKEIEADIGARLRLTFVDNTDAVGNLEELTSNKAAKWDAQMSPVVHETFKCLPRNLLLDMSFWQWLSITRYKKFSYLYKNHKR